MKEDGTVNRGVLPAIFNPEDLNALEMALEVKDRIDDAEVVIVTMGPPRAADIIRESIYRGADRGFLVTDRRFAGSDTLATSYAISQAVKMLEPYHMIFAGRQAIDGDTAQVGPQVAEKLNIPQITYAETVEDVDENRVIITRRLENGVEKVSSRYPVAVTVHSSAPECRTRNAKRVMKYKYAKTQTEIKDTENHNPELFKARPYLNIVEWSVDDIKADTERLGLSGSPTKVKNIDSVVFTQKESVQLDNSDESIDNLMETLISSHVIG